MSAGFEFAKKHEITICGRAYPCDISDKRMLEGVTRDFPRVLQAAQAFCAMDAKLKPGGQDGRSADTMAQEALEKFSDAVAMCRAFIEGTLPYGSSVTSDGLNSSNGTGRYPFPAQPGTPAQPATDALLETFLSAVARSCVRESGSSSPCWFSSYIKRAPRR